MSYYFSNIIQETPSCCQDIYMIENEGNYEE